MKSRVVVVAVVEKEGKYLVGQKPEGIGPYPNTWHTLGGGVDLENETLEEAVKRETREEAGIEINNIKPIAFDEDNEPDKHGEMTHYVFLSFKADYVLGEIQAGDDMANLIWASREELSKLNLNKPSRKLFKSLNLI